MCLSFNPTAMRKTNTSLLPYKFFRMLSFITAGTTLTFLLVLSAGCTKDNQEHPLPPSLRQKFTCEIDGEFWSSSQEGPGCVDIHARFYEHEGVQGENPPAFLSIQGKDCKTSSLIGFSMDSIYTVGDYHFPSNNWYGVFFDREGSRADTLGVNPPEHYRYYAVEGVVNITQMEPSTYVEVINPDTGQPILQGTSGWIAGTFEMTLTNKVVEDSNNIICDTIRITDGKFTAILN